MARLRQTILPPFLKDKFNLSSQTATAHSADFTDFEEVIGSEHKNLFVAICAPLLTARNSCG
jgi:hypothetical protein